MKFLVEYIITMYVVISVICAISHVITNVLVNNDIIKF